jgi:hypothetical protein
MDVNAMTKKNMIVWDEFFHIIIMKNAHALSVC